MSELDERIHELRQQQDAINARLAQQITNLVNIAVDATMECDRMHTQKVRAILSHGEYQAIAEARIRELEEENTALRQERDEAQQDADRWARLYEACKRYRSGYEVQES